MKPSANRKKERLLHLRHEIITAVLYLPVYLYCRLFYHAQMERFTNPQRRNFLVLHNHVTPVDELFIHLMLRRKLAYVATEDIFSNGLVSKLLTFCFALIPIDKTAMDLSAVKKCLRAAKEGANVVIAPEGNRTYSGHLGYIKPSIVSLARSLKLPLLLIRIDGGFGVNPRWSDKNRRGPMTVQPVRVIEPEEMKQMTDEELYRAIQDAISVQDCENGQIYTGSHRAEYMERAVYTCPFCGFSHFESFGNRVRCLTCRREVAYGADQQLQGVGFDFPYKTFSQWYDGQSRFLLSSDPASQPDMPYFTDAVRIFAVTPGKRKQRLEENSKLALFGNRITIDGTAYPFDELRSMAVLGRNKLNIRRQGGVLQIKGDKHFNALKYVQFYYHYIGKRKDTEHAEFLGL